MGKITLTPARDHTGQDILLAEVDGECVGNFRLIGKHHADLGFRFYQDGPREIRFPMADRWPTIAEAQRIIERSYAHAP